MKRLLGCLATSVLLLLAVLLAVLDGTPLVERGETISPASIAQARRLLARHDPRRLQRGDERTAEIPASLLDDAVNYLASRYLHARGAFLLAEESAEVALAVRVPAVLGERYLNLRAVFREAEGEPGVVAANIGRVPVPPAIADLLIASAVSLAGFAEDWELLQKSVRRLAFEPARGVVAVTYVWRPEILERARSLAFAPADVGRLEVAQRALAAVLDHHAPRARVPFPRVLASLLQGSDDVPQPQRRAALLVLASYLAGQPLAKLLPEAGQWPRARPVKLILLGREDSAQHFAISAALAAWAGEPAANAIGVYKEIQDSRHGSGFSFADLAADRAGTRFGQLVVSDSPRLGELLRGTLSDGDLSPSLAGLPEYLPENEFIRRYGGIDSAAYRELLEDIEGRLAALPLYR